MTTMAAGEAYLQALAHRLTADGCSVTQENWNGGIVLIGRRADFRVQWMATKLHLFTVATVVPAISTAGMQAFTTNTMNYVTRDILLGVQSGAAVFPTMISPNVEVGADAWAAEKQRNQFACMGRPVVVDTTRGAVSCFRGTAMLGWIYSSHLRRKLNTYFPQNG
jgi:hypothetical protein